MLKFGELKEGKAYKDNYGLIYEKRNGGLWCVTDDQYSQLEMKTIMDDLEFYEIKQLSEDEKIILRNISDEYKFITRDFDGDLEIHEEAPVKGDIYWRYGNATFMHEFKHLFQCVRWEDERATLIEDLLDTNIEKSESLEEGSEEDMHSECPYCTMNEKYNEGECIPSDDGGELFIYCGNKLYSENPGSRSCSTVEISHCPVCGKKLEEN